MDNKPTFSFPSSSGASTGGLFGSTQTPASKPPTSALFGSTGSGSGFAFGKPAASPASSTPGAQGGASASGGLFTLKGTGTPIGGGMSTPSSGAPAFSFSGTGATPFTPSSTSAAPGAPAPATSAPTSLFSKSGGIAGSVTPLSGFTPGSAGAAAASNTPGFLNTPALGGASTTPASVPKNPLFGQASAASAAPAPSSTFSLGGAATSAAKSPSFGTLASGAGSGSGSAPVPGGSTLFGGQFGKSSAASASATMTTAASASAPSFGLLGGASSQPASSAMPAPSLGFGVLSGGSSQAGGSTVPTLSAAPGGGGGGGIFAKPAASSAAPASSAPAASSASSSGGLSLFGGGPKPAASSGLSTLGASAVGSAPAAASTPPLGASTTLPASSRLKNKSMDEILTRWATDLTKYQKDFQKQASQVAEWDRLLVENTDKIGKLITKTLAAERDASEVERQLKSVEDQQSELEQFLDKYEGQVDELVRANGLDRDTGVIAERERTYKLAGKLTDRLDSLNKDLTDVIEEINGVSATLNNNSGPDDPLSNVVRVLNSHLQKLQKIDVDAAALQNKVKEAQKQVNGLSSNGWPEDTAAQDFYASYRRNR